ncbi:MAG: hypothetical protein ACOC5S_01255 [Acidobacteriota bacterium]
MKLGTKVGIFLAACLITFVGFNLLIPKGAVDMIKAGKANSYSYKIASNGLFVDLVKGSPFIKG